MTEQKCKGCGEMVEGEMSDSHPCYDFYCECGESWCDSQEYFDVMADRADNMRKAQKEGR